MRVTILPDRDVKEVDARTVGDLLRTLGLHRDAHLVVRGEDILTSDVRLAEADEVEVWPVISGGCRLDPPHAGGLNGCFAAAGRPPHPDPPPQGGREM
jgi:sulfur carrier protein